MKTLKAPESVVYDYVASYARANGRGPTYREIAHALSVGTTTIKKRIDALSAQGLVELPRCGPRTGVMPSPRPSHPVETGVVDGCRSMRCDACGGEYVMGASRYLLCPMCGTQIA